MHASLPHPHSGPLSVAPSIPTQPASFLAPSTPSARLPLIQVSFFNPLLASCFCPLHAVQSSTCFSGVHHFFHPSSPVRFPCSCFSLPYFCTSPPPTLSILLAASLYLITLWFVCFPFFHSSFSSRYSSNLPRDCERMSVRCCPITD